MMRWLQQAIRHCYDIYTAGCRRGGLQARRRRGDNIAANSQCGGDTHAASSVIALSELLVITTRHTQHHVNMAPIYDAIISHATAQVARATLFGYWAGPRLPW